MLDYQAQKAIIEEQDKQGGQEAGCFPPSSSYPPLKQAANRSSFPGGGQSQAASSTNASNTFGNSLGSNQEPPKQKRPISSNTRRSGKATSKGSVSRGSRAGNTSQNRQSLGVVSQNSAEQINVAQSKNAMEPNSPGLHIISS